MTAAAESFHFHQADERTERPLHERLAAELPMMGVLQRMAAESGQPPMRLARDFAALSFGPGKITFADYTRLRLHDEAYWAGADRRSIVGARRAHELAHRLNHRQDWHGVAGNKLAANAYLAAFGFPVIPHVALYAHELATPAKRLLRTREELRQFLTERAPYPLIGKPMEGGLGVTGLESYDIESGVLRTLEGRRLGVDDFVDRVRESYAGGYLFQPLLAPQAGVAKLVGRRLACVRLITLSTAMGPKLFRAVWKLPAGRNLADTTSLPGNLMAALDPRNGAVLRVIRGQGFELEDVTRHPDTGAGLLGAKIPGWEALKATALEAARLVAALPLIGWDIAPTASGPVILQMDVAPDLTATQLVERRGALDADLYEALAEQRQLAHERAELLKAEIAAL